MMKGGFDRSRSLQELERQAREDPSTGDTTLVTTCLRLRRKPLSDFTVGDLRIMIGQQIGLPYLVPLAVECLEENPLVEANFYPGDLLVFMLSVDGAFWESHADSFQRIRRIVRRVLESGELDNEDYKHLRHALEKAPKPLTE